MFLHWNTHKYNWTSPNGKTHNHIDHILLEELTFECAWCMNFRGAECNPDHCQMVAKVREKLAVGKQATQQFDAERFNLWKLNEQFQIKIWNRFAALEGLRNFGGGWTHQTPPLVGHCLMLQGWTTHVYSVSPVRCTQVEWCNVNSLEKHTAKVCSIRHKQLYVNSLNTITLSLFAWQISTHLLCFLATGVMTSPTRAVTMPSSLLHFPFGIILLQTTRKENN